MGVKKSDVDPLLSISEYDTIASKYDLIFNILSSGQIQKTKKLALEKIEPDEDILEVGCGTGWLSCQCAKKGAKVVAVDISKTMLELAKERAKISLVDENIQFMKLDFLNEGLPNIKKRLSIRFDKVIFCYILDIFPEEVTVCRLIKNAKELLKNDGEIIIIDELVPNNPVAKKVANLFRFPVFKYLEKTTNMKYHRMHDFIYLLHKLGFEDINVERMSMGYLGILTVRNKMI